MAEEGIVSNVRESGDHHDFVQAGSSSIGHGRPTQMKSYELSDSQSSSPKASASVSPIPLPRTSIDSIGRSSLSRWQDIPQNATNSERDQRDGESVAPSDTPTLVDASFDETVLRALCDLDCGIPLILDRIKQSTVSCKEASLFFKKRAIMEEEYGKTLQKLAKSSSETYTISDGKAGSYVTAWQATLRIHEQMAENRVRFAQRLNEMGDELANLAKEVDKNRKQTKDLATRYERSLQESESATEKTKSRLEISSEELERILLQKEGESLNNAVQPRTGATGGKRAIGKAVAKGGLLLKGKNPGNIQRQEDDIRSRVSTASDQYRKAMMDTQHMRQEYFNFQLPRLLRSLKECADEMDLGTQYHLTRYAFLYESIVLSDGSILVPPREEGLGLKASIETIDNRGDFRVYMQHYAYAKSANAPRGPRRDGPAEEGFLPPIPLPLNHVNHSDKPSLISPMINGANHSPATPVTTNPSSGGSTNGPASGLGVTSAWPTFGVDLGEQMDRDNVEVPRIVEKCCKAIEKYGMHAQGIYRISGVANKVMGLRQQLDKDLDVVDLDGPEWSGDSIHIVTGVLKMWLRDLPEPLLTTNLYQGFIDAARIENDRLRQIRLHERVNDLPDPNYATLKFFLGHLHRIIQNATVNAMTVQNLAIIFGPTLFGSSAAVHGQSNGGMVDATLQNQAIETILNRYNDIFIDEAEDIGISS